MVLDLKQINTQEWKNIARPVMDTTDTFIDAFDKVIRFVNYFSISARETETRTDKICLDTINKVERNHMNTVDMVKKVEHDIRMKFTDFEEEIQRQMRQLVKQKTEDLREVLEIKISDKNIQLKEWTEKKLNDKFAVFETKMNKKLDEVKGLFHVPDYIATGRQPTYKTFAEFVQRTITGQKADQ